MSGPTASDYRQQLDNLARHLAAIASAPHEPLTGMDLDAATAGFTATVQLLRKVHFDVVGSGPGIPLTLSSLDRPVPLLGRLLRDLPDLDHDVAPTDLQITPAQTATGAHWRVVARSATLAAHYWTTLPQPPTPVANAPATTVEVVAVATLTQALAALAPALADHLKAAGRLWEAARLRTANLTALRVVAECARHAVTADQDLTEAPNPPPPRRHPPHPVLVMRRAEDLAPGLHRLAALIETSAHLSPHHIRLIVRATAAAALAAVPVLAAAGHDLQAAALGEQADLLLATVRGPVRLTTTYRGDVRPLAQAQQINLYLASAARAGTVLPPETALAIAASVPLVTTAAAALTQRMISTAAWLQPSEAAQVTWEPTGQGRHVPALLEHLTAAAARAAQSTSVNALHLGPPGTGRVSSRSHLHRPAATAPRIAATDAEPGHSTSVPARARPTRPQPAPPVLAPPGPRPGPPR